MFVPVSSIVNRFLRLVTYLFCCWSAFVQATLPEEECALFDDWVATSNCRNLCHGYYVEPTVNFPGQSQEFLAKQPITVTADQGEFLPDGESILIGNVHLTQGNRQLRADRAFIHRTAEKNALDKIRVEGHVRLTEPGIRVDGTYGEYDVPAEMQMLENTAFRFYEKQARGTAKTTLLQGQNRMILRKATYTTCAPGQDTWELRARKVVLNKETGRGQATHARLHIENIPVFYVPYLDFPIDNRRQTGFLYPDYGSSNQSGSIFSLPFYWNMAPNYDATLTTRLLTERGVEEQVVFRYLLPNNSQGSIQAGLLPNDRKYLAFRNQSLNFHPGIGNTDPRITALNKTVSRRALRVDHSSRFNPNWALNLQYQTVGDDNYFMDLGSNLGLAETVQLLQLTELLYQDEYWTAQTRVQQYQTLHPFNGPSTAEVYRKLPQIAAQNSCPDLPYGFESQGNGDFTRFTHKILPVSGSSVTTGDRFHLRPGLIYPIVTPGWYIKPRIQFDILTYSLALSTTAVQLNQPAHPTRTVPMFDVDSGLIFERYFRLCQTPFIQTLEPRFYYLYVPYRNYNPLPNFDTSHAPFDYNQLYRDNRFTGFDRVGDANQVTVGVSTRFLESKTGSEKLLLSIGQILYFEDRRVTACNPLTTPNCVAIESPPLPNGKQRRFSPLAGIARAPLSDCFIVNANVEWDPYKERVNKGSFFVQYRPSDLTVANVGYQYLRYNVANLSPITNLPQKLEQTDTSLAWRLTEQWRVLGKWHYDIKNQHTNDFLVGIEQQGCCTALRFSFTRFLLPNAGQIRYTDAFLIQFVFKGFTSVGNKDMGSYLKRSIPGYVWHGEDL